MAQRLLLIHPPTPAERTYPLGLAYLAAVATKEGVRVSGFDLRVRPRRQLTALLRRQPFDFVGLTALSTTVDEAARIVRSVRRHQPTALVVVGGPHATLAPREVLDRTQADVAVRGDGETPLAGLLAGDLHAPGATLRGTTQVAPIHVQENLDSLAEPDREVFPIDDYYRSGFVSRARRTSLVATRGCTMSCGYCSAPELSQRCFRKRSVGSVLEEMTRLRLDHEVQGFVFEDDNLLLDRGWARHLFESVSDRLPDAHIDLPNGVHPGLLDEEMLGVMHRAGVRSIAFGIESVTASRREALGRGFEAEHLEKLCQRARSLGMMTTGYFLVGLPGESQRDALSSVRLLRALGLDVVHVSVLRALPGQPIQGVPDRSLWRWRWIRRGMYAAYYADPSKVIPLVDRAGGGVAGTVRLLGRAAAWWR